MIELTRTSSGSLSKPLEGELVLEVIRWEVLRLKVVGFDEVVLAESELGEVDVDNAALGDDPVGVGDLVVLGAESLVGREEGFVSEEKKHVWNRLVLELFEIFNTFISILYPTGWI